MSPLRVFVIDPDEQRGAWLERIVAAQGHEVERFANGEKAIDRFVQKPADAVLVEYVLPGRDGVATVEAIRWAPGGRDVRVILLADEEPVSAPLSMLALRVDATTSLVGPLEEGAVERALAELDREWSDEGTLALEDESYARHFQEARRNSSVPATAPAVQEWLDAATVIAGAVRVETAENLFGDEPTTRGNDVEIARAMVAADKPPASFDDVTSTEPGLAVQSATTVSTQPLDASSARAILGISGGKIVGRPFAARSSASRPLASSQSVPLSSSRAPSGTTSTGATGRVASPPATTTPAAGTSSTAARFAAARGGTSSFRAPTGMVRITGIPAAPGRSGDVGRPEATDRPSPSAPVPIPEGTRPAQLLPATGPTSEQRATNVVGPDPHTVDEGRFVRAQARDSEDDGGEWSGSFAAMPFPALLRRIADERATGGLVCTLTPARGDPRTRQTRTTVDGDVPTKVVFFRGGVPVHVRSNLVDECLGQLLLRKKRIGNATLDESIRRMRDGGGLQGQILVDMGALAPIELGELLAEQVRQKLFDLFGWRRGEFRFSSKLEAPRDGVALEMALPDMVYEGVCAAMPATLLLDIMTPRLELFVVPDPVRLARFARVRVAADLRTALERLDGSIRLREVLRLGQRPGAIAQLVYALECLSAVSYAESATLRRVVLAPLSMDQAVAAAEEAMREIDAPPPPPVPDHAEDAAWDDVTNKRDDGKSFAAEAQTAGGRPGMPAPAPARPAPAHTPPEVAALASVSLSALVELHSPVSGSPALASAAVVSPPFASAYASPVVELASHELGAGVTGPRAPLSGGGDPRGLDAHVDRMFEAERCFRRGNRSLARGELRDALAAFERAVELCPDEAEFVAYRGWARHGVDPTSERAIDAALADLARSTELAPDLHVTHLLQARVLEHAGRHGEALRAYREALALEPAMREAEEAVARLTRGRA